MRRPVRVVGLLMLAALWIGYLSIGHFLSKPATRLVGPAPLVLSAKDIEFASDQGDRVSGWLAAGRPGSGVVLLLHGVRSNRLQMVPRATFLHEAGYGVMLIDLPAHGESGGSRITFGANESSAVTAAIRFLRQHFPDEKIGVIGVSLGAASTVLSKPAGSVSAVVLESMYPTIQEAVADRMEIRLGAAGRFIAPALLWQLPIYAGTDADSLQPERAMASLSAPVVIASGDRDLHTHWSETERLFASAADPKELWKVRGAAHVDLYDFTPSEYQRRVLAFLGKHLHNEH
ncbi:alpha/beta hydrolase [Ideonella sp. DXS29W]|uniref:Alpha/beta hydrolase n=1 Tax=Ideonella lacteola TaxID=2984193 RepID=A0ABU9BXZ5_9BURK